MKWGEGMLMKALKSVCVLMALTVVLCFSGCGSKADNNSNETNGSDGLNSSIVLDVSCVPEHEHSFRPDDCENPQICDCGATRGEPIGHSWDGATCTTPKTCLACGKTEGEALGHDYVDSICSVCLAHDPETIVDSPNVWISSDGKYHSTATRCFAPGEEGVKTTMAKARAQGYRACGKCYVIN